MVASPVAPTLNLDDILKTRGIYDVAQEFGWQAHPYQGMPGWRYPLTDSKGHPFKKYDKPAYRWKNADSSASEGKKYVWIPGKPEDIRYYMLPGAVDAIKATETVYIASGEPDLLAYRAAGVKNALCWFGEKNIPATLAEDMKLLGVWRVWIAPDRDNPGLEACAKVRAMFDDTVAFNVIELPAEVGSKYDINRHWIQMGFNARAFTESLALLPLIDDVTLSLYAIDAPQEGGQKAFQDTEKTELPDAFKQALIRHVEGMPGFKYWNDKGFSTNFKCPFHDDHTASACFNRDSMSLVCFACGPKPAKEFGAQVGIHLRDYFEPTPKPAAAPVLRLATPAPKPTPQPAESLWIDSDAVAREIIAQLEGRSLPAVEPLAFPFDSLKEFGGFAELMWPGKLIYISGVSGGGKTSFGESLYTPLVERGISGLWYGPEWSPIEMGLRFLQRQGGMNMAAMSRYQIHLIEDSKNLPAAQRKGTAKDTAVIQTNIDKMRRMLSWPGKMSYMRPNAEIKTMDQLIDEFERKVLAMRAEGHDVRTLWFDYLQRAPKAGSARGWDWAEEVVSAIKSLCERQNLFGFCFVQPKKTDSRKARDGENLNESSGQGISDQQANLYLTLTPGFNSKQEREPYVKVSIVKNSMGTTGVAYLQTRLDRLAVVDSRAVFKGGKPTDVIFEGELGDEPNN